MSGRVAAGILGPGNIGTDLLVKLQRSAFVDVRLVVGIYDDKITRVNVRPAQINQTNIVLADSRQIQERFAGYIQNMLAASQERDEDIESAVIDVE